MLKSCIEAIMKEKTILIVDDTITNLNILTDLLCGYDVIGSGNGFDALKIVEKEKIDLILLDIMMPKMNGFEVCQTLKTNEKTKNIPIIFISSLTDETNIEMAYEIGANDYITKPFKPKELLAKVKRELQIQSLINSLEQSKKELELLASTDSLTKLYNRRYFTQASLHILNLCKREKKQLSLLIIDIDKFKFINDNHGHKIGDNVIIHMANILLNDTRQSDISCRFGGEEFVVLLPNTPLEDGVILANKLRKKVESSILKTDNGDLKYTISLGVSSVDIEIDDDIEEALKKADKALYTSKNLGRNRVTTR
jgi:diguanylate cyclase (GGDEF)-like protein